MTNEELKKLEDDGVIVKELTSKSGVYKVRLSATTLFNAIVGILYNQKSNTIVSHNVIGYGSLDELVNGWDFNLNKTRELMSRH